MSTIVTDELLEAEEPVVEADDSEGAEVASSSPRRSISVSPKWFAANLLPPALGIGAFLLLWALLAPRVNTSLGALPGPAEVLDAGRELWNEYRASQADEAAFYAAQEVRNADLAAAGQPLQDFQFSGPPTFLDQIWTSLRTVALGLSLIHI